MYSFLKAFLVLIINSFLINVVTKQQESDFRHRKQKSELS